MKKVILAFLVVSSAAFAQTDNIYTIPKKSTLEMTAQFKTDVYLNHRNSSNEYVPYTDVYGDSHLIKNPRTPQSTYTKDFELIFGKATYHCTLMAVTFGNKGPALKLSTQERKLKLVTFDRKFVLYTFQSEEAHVIKTSCDTGSNQFPSLSPEQIQKALSEHNIIVKDFKLVNRGGVKTPIKVEPKDAPKPNEKSAS